MSHPLPKLLICTTGLGSGGAETMLVQLLRQIHGHSAQCEVIALAAGGKHAAALEEIGIPVHDLGLAAGKVTPIALLRLLKLARAARPDVLIGWMYHGNLAATLARWIVPGKPRLVWNIRQTLYDLALEKRGSAMVIRALAKLSRQADAILYNSRLSAQQHGSIGYDSTRALVVPNGFEIDHFKPDPQARASVLQELQLPADTLLIGRIGRNAAMKDHPTALAALAKVCATLPQARVLWAGTGLHASEEPFATFLRQHPDCQSRFHLLGERFDLPRLTAALDLAISSSAYGEGFPNVIGEAMACGVPVVATDIGDTAWVIGEKAGLIVPAKNPEALATACLQLLSAPPDQRQNIGTAGRQRILNHFDIRTTYQQYQTLFLPPKTPPSHLVN